MIAGHLQEKKGYYYAVLNYKLSAFYGLRRSEVLGLKWDAIDFERNTISIHHTVTSCTVDGRYTIVAADTTKTKSSRHTLPLVAPVRDLLLNLRERPAENQRVYPLFCTVLP